MSGPLVLDFDPTGQNQDNRISGEMHLLNVSTGRIFALNYGGFYTRNLVIRDPLTNTTLNPISDFVVLGPYDNITKQTGLEAACVIVIKIATWQREWEVSYNAVGGDYSTNVQAIRDIIALQSVEVNSVRWGDILNKPAGFNTAPHLIDFRKDLFGFEGLIESIDRVGEKLAPLSPSEASVILSQVQAALNTISASLGNAIASLEQDVNNLNIPDVSGFLSGTWAGTDDIQTGIAGNKALSAANISNLNKRFRMSKQLPGSAAATIFDTSIDPVVTGDFNFRPYGDASVPNETLTYIVETIWWRVELNDPSAKRGYQIATCITDNPAYYGTVLYRARYTGATAPGSWTRIDANKIKNVPNLSLAVQSTRAWATAADDALMTPLQTKLFLQENADYIIPVGSVIAYAGETKNWTNSNYMFCHGQLISISAYPELFSRIGFTYMELSNSAVFRLPDTRGVVIRGDDAGRGLDSPSRLFGSYQADAFAEHFHSLGANVVTETGTGDVGGIASSGNMYITATQPTGGEETRMKNISMNFIIRVK